MVGRNAFVNTYKQEQHQGNKEFKDCTGVSGSFDTNIHTRITLTDCFYVFYCVLVR